MNYLQGSPRNRPHPHLFVAGELVPGLVVHELRLADQEGDEPHAVMGELVVHIAQPFERVLGHPLGLVAEQHDDVAVAQLELLGEATQQGEALLGDRGWLGMANACGAEQCAEEGALEVAAMMLARSPPGVRRTAWRSRCNGSGRSANGAPLRSAPGFLCSSGM
jgi:hypothetical protein